MASPSAAARRKSALPRPSTAASTSPRATLLGLSAVLLWSTLATLTTQVRHIPPFELTALSLGVGAVSGLLPTLFRPGAAAPAFRQRWTTWAIGVAGIFGYHALYFLALQTAPPAAASLLAYLWPLLIVLLSGLLPGASPDESPERESMAQASGREMVTNPGRLRWVHGAGALVAFVGSALVVDFSPTNGVYPYAAVGYAAALLCALVWSVYSVTLRVALRHVPTESVAGFCALSAILSLVCHLVFEETVWPTGGLEWGAVGLLGVGPLGLAFYLWDIGMKRGEPRVLGALSYAAPVLSTALLVAWGRAAPSLQLAAAALAVAFGAALAARR